MTRERTGRACSNSSASPRSRLRPAPRTSLPRRSTTTDQRHADAETSRRFAAAARSGTFQCHRRTAEPVDAKVSLLQSRALIERTTLVLAQAEEQVHRHLVSPGTHCTSGLPVRASGCPVVRARIDLVAKVTPAEEQKTAQTRQHDGNQAGKECGCAHLSATGSERDSKHTSTDEILLDRPGDLRLVDEIRDEFAHCTRHS